MRTLHEPLCTGNKTCNKCNRSLNVLEFSTDKKNPDGLQNRCRECTREHSKHSPCKANMDKHMKAVEKKKIGNFLADKFLK